MAKLRDKIKKASQRVLIYGPPKTGKTEAVARLSEHFNLLWFDLENGYSTMLKLPEEWQDRITLISLPDTRSWPVAISTLLKVVRGSEHTICEQHGSIACPKCKAAGAPVEVVNLSKLPPNTIVVFDSLTQLTNSVISKLTLNKPDDYKLERDDWANLGKLMDMFLSHIQQAPYSVVCISHENEAEYEDGKIKIVPVSGTKNFSRNTAKYFDHVAYAEIKNKKHKLASATDYSMSIQTGSRLDVRLEDSEEVSLYDIFRHLPKWNEAIEGELVDTPILDMSAETPVASSSESEGVKSLSTVAGRVKLNMNKGLNK